MVRSSAYTQRANRAEIRKKVRAQLVFFFGKFRPATELTVDQQKTVDGERKEYEIRITDLLADMDATMSAITSALTGAMIEIRAEPHTMPMPNPEGIAERVRRRLLPSTQDHQCAACAAGHRIRTSSGHMDPHAGVLLIRQTGDWLCLVHHEALSWVVNRSRVLSDGKLWPYPPPWFMLVTEDCPLYAWALKYAETVYGKAPVTELDAVRPEDV